jgi:hypothetical protein
MPAVWMGTCNRDERSNRMDRKLHLLETFTARGSDGNTYTVRGYEHLARLDGVPEPLGQWEPTGEAEYRLADGPRLDVDGQGHLILRGLRASASKPFMPRPSAGLRQRG